MEWEQGNRLPWGTGREFEVWLIDGSVRRVCPDDWNGVMLKFTDCTHPAQNSHCSWERIAAWRMLPRRRRLELPHVDDLAPELDVVLIKDAHDLGPQQAPVFPRQDNEA